MAFNRKLTKFVDQALSDLIDSSIELFVNAIESIEEQLLKLIDKLTVDNSGNIVLVPQRAKIATKLYQDAIMLFNKIYNKAALAHVRSYTKINQLNHQAFQRALGARVIQPKTVSATFRALASLDYNVHQSLSRDTLSRIAKATYTAILTGGNVETLKASISGILVGAKDVRGRPLVQYSKTYAQDQIMQYYATVHMAAGERLGYTKWRYVGTIIDTTREFCERQLNQVRTKEEWEKIGKDEDWKGKSCSEILICRGGYGCRHHFQAVET